MFSKFLYDLFAIVLVVLHLSTQCALFLCLSAFSLTLVAFLGSFLGLSPRLSGYSLSLVIFFGFFGLSPCFSLMVVVCGLSFLLWANQLGVLWSSFCLCKRLPVFLYWSHDGGPKKL